MEDILQLTKCFNNNDNVGNGMRTGWVLCRDEVSYHHHPVHVMHEWSTQRPVSHHDLLTPWYVTNGVISHETIIESFDVHLYTLILRRPLYL